MMEELLLDCWQKGICIFSETLKVSAWSSALSAKTGSFAQHASHRQHLMPQLCSSLILRDSHLFRVLRSQPGASKGYS